MANCNCDDRIQGVAKWISKTLKGESRLIPSISTPQARDGFSKALLGTYDKTSPELNVLLDVFGQTREIRLSALREGAAHLAHSAEYRDRVARDIEKKERRFNPKRDTVAAFA